MHGHCTCGAVLYRLADAPMFVQACHCSWSQRESGSAFAVNALVERDLIEVTGEVAHVMLVSASGKGQEVVRCPACGVTLWSHYGSLRRKLAFVRVGTLEEPGGCPPHAHIFTATRLPWVMLPADVPAFEDYYSTAALWPAESFARRKALMA